MVFHSSATRKDADSAAVASASVERWVFVSSNALPRWISYYSHCTMHCVHFAHFRAVQMWTSSHIHLIFDFCGCRAVVANAISHTREAGVHRTLLKTRRVVSREI